MQTFGLPRQITRGAALASRLCGKERSDEAHRRDALERWRQARGRRPDRTSGCQRRRRAEIDPLPVAEAGGPQPPQAVLAPPAHTRAGPLGRRRW